MTPVRAKGLLAAAVSLLFWGSPAHGATVEEIKFVAQEMACLCGTCPTRPLDECNCGFAGQKRDEIGSLLDAGKDKKAIIASFISRDGLQVLAVPPAEGFNLSAWVMPFAVLFGGGFVVLYVVRTWSQGKDARQKIVAARNDPPPNDDDPYRSQLESELRDRDT